MTMTDTTTTTTAAAASTATAATVVAATAAGRQQHGLETRYVSGPGMFFFSFFFYQTNIILGLLNLLK